MLATAHAQMQAYEKVERRRLENRHTSYRTVLVPAAVGRATGHSSKRARNSDRPQHQCASVGSGRQAGAGSCCVPNRERAVSLFHAVKKLIKERHRKCCLAVCWRYTTPLVVSELRIVQRMAPSHRAVWLSRQICGYQAQALPSRTRIAFHVLSTVRTETEKSCRQDHEWQRRAPPEPPLSRSLNHARSSRRG
jgi:hypothetical protein